MSDPSAEQQRILVVDDEDYLTDLLSTSLRFQGFEVETAANGFQALSATGSFEPDLIVLDVKMPDICLLYTSPSPRDQRGSRMPSSA